MDELKNIITIEQLAFFKKEIKEAGGFLRLMIKKDALKEKRKGWYIINHNDPVEYARIYLTEVYEPLRVLYKTNTPFAFWFEVYKIAQSA